MKTIGIIGAMEEEIVLLKSVMEIVSAKKIIGVDFYLGKMHGKNTVLVRSGIGKVNAAICTQVLINLYGADYVINTGVAGAIHKELDIGDIIISDDCVQHDFDCSFVGDPPGVIPRMNESFFKADEELVRIAKGACTEAVKDKKVLVGRIASGDQFIASAEAKNKIWSLFKAYGVEMEGAAIAQTCHLNKIPFVVIRAVSDKADESATMSFESFAKIASKNSSDSVEQIIKVI